MWISRQQKNYQEKKYIMIYEEIYNKWTEFINNNKYKIYFQTNEENWMQTLNQVKAYIDENNKKPSSEDKNVGIKKLGIWIGTQQKNYQGKKYIMSNEEIYNRWIEFINDNKYKIYFQKNEENWIQTLNQVKAYIDENNKKPSLENKNIEIKKLGSWLSGQQQNYQKERYIMNNEEIYNTWT